ncbi:MAG: hypothetical protein FJ279_01690 [Planctomycetes bacterium]|nr:hypothetical protein [Planctomycetota bacterium]
MTLRLAVRGEGPSDYGRWDHSQDRQEQEGCYLAFVRAALAQDPGELPLELNCVSAGRFPRKLPGGKAKRKLPRLKGFERHAFYATLEASQQGAQCLVIGADTDRGLEGKKTRLPQACLERYEQFRVGHEKATKFHGATEGVRLVALVPLVKLESWLLADENAFRSAAGFERGVLPRMPEELYGQTDAKEHLTRLFRKHSRGEPEVADKARLALAASPKVLSNECPISYPPFLDGVRKLGTASQA